MSNFVFCYPVVEYLLFNVDVYTYFAVRQVNHMWYMISKKRDIFIDSLREITLEFTFGKNQDNIANLFKILIRTSPIPQYKAFYRYLLHQHLQNAPKTIECYLKAMRQMVCLKNELNSIYFVSLIVYTIYNYFLGMFLFNNLFL